MSSFLSSTLENQLRRLESWESRRLAMDAAAYQRTARSVLRQLRTSCQAQQADQGAGEVLRTFYENLYFEQHGRFSEQHTSVPRQIQQLAWLTINRARARGAAGALRASRCGPPQEGDGALAS